MSFSEPPRRRMALGRTPRRLSFERRLRISLWVLGAPLAGVVAGLLWARGVGWAGSAAVLVCVAGGWGVGVSLVTEQVVRPLQTLANVVASLREDDYSLRARGGRRNDAVGDLAIEVNALAGMLQSRRGADLEAMALLERVMSAMQSPVLAFAPDGGLRLLNAAAGQAFGLEAGRARGRRAGELGLEHLLWAGDDELIALGGRGESSRWIVQRSSFRLHGVPHALLVLSDVSAALREEERMAWRRLIRVMGHEINNSLTPIKSIAGSLRGRARERLRSREGMGEGEQEQELERDMERGLAVIENRAESLNRFLQAYTQLAQLPPPRRRLVAMGPLLEKVCRLETRLGVRLAPGPEVMLDVDADQLEQALINLVKNGVDAALEGEAGGTQGEGQGRDGRGDGEGPQVDVGWRVVGADGVVTIADTGAGIANESNLFVPFYTTKAEGTGVGLVLALQILEAHGGTVRLRNRMGRRGCEAEVRVPVVR